MEYFIRSAKGTAWSNHKYIDIVNGRYIYPEDRPRPNNPSASSEQRLASQGNAARLPSFHNRVKFENEHSRRSHIKKTIRDGIIYGGIKKARQMEQEKKDWRKYEIEDRVNRLAEQRKQERAGHKAERRGRQVDYNNNVIVPRKQLEKQMRQSHGAIQDRERSERMDKAHYKYGTFKDKMRLYKVKAERITNEIIDKIRNSNIFNNLFGNKRK